MNDNNNTPIQPAATPQPAQPVQSQPSVQSAQPAAPTVAPTLPVIQQPSTQPLQTPVPPQAPPATPQPLPAQTTPQPAPAPIVYPNRNPIVVKKKSSVGGVLGSIVGFIMFFIVVFFIYGLSWEEPSNVEATPTPTPYVAVEATPTGPPTTLTFIPQASILQMHSIVDAATSLQEIDTQLTAAIEKAENPPGRSKKISTPRINTTNVTNLMYNNTLDFPNLKITPLSNADLEDTKKYLGYFIDEYTKYPLEFMPAVNPPTFAFARRVIDSSKGGDAGGYTNHIVLYRVQVMNRTDEPFIHYLHSIIHHEIGHSFHGLKYPKGDPNWPGLLYKDSYKSHVELGAQSNHDLHPAPGFVTGYAQSNYSEDYAETYAYMFLRQDYLKATEWAKTDKVLAQKIEYLKKRMQEYTTKMDDAYFLSLD